MNTYGQVEDIGVKGLNIVGENHVKSIMNKLPTFIPPSWQGTLHDLKFSLPIVFRVN